MPPGVGMLVRQEKQAVGEPPGGGEISQIVAIPDADRLGGINCMLLINKAICILGLIGIGFLLPIHIRLKG